MKKQSFDFKETGFFGTLFNDFISQKESLRPFYTSLESLDLESFNIDLDKRDALVATLQEQSKGIQLSSKSIYNLNLLKEKNTLTVTTGHQLNLMGGPLFFTYKILSTIKACEEYAKEFTKYNFVPVYWMATEDHDFEEINHFFLFGKKYSWTKDVENKAVGDLGLEDLQLFLTEITDIPDNIKKCYLESKTLKEAHLKLVNELFGAYGILILDANTRDLKKSFIDFAIKEINNQVVYNQVNISNTLLTNLRYKTQVSPRECNLFYQKEGTRYRIEVKEEQVHLIGAEEIFSKTDFIALINNNPSLISQNVLTRPLYQQQILPNIAYVGGPGEIAYWLQLKGLFESQSFAFPILIPRFFALYLPEYVQVKMDKAGLQIEQLFQAFETIKQEILLNDTEGVALLKTIDAQFENYKNGVLDSLKNQLNLSLQSFAEGSMTRIEKEHQNISKRVKKEIEARNSIKIDRIKNIFDTLFPEGELQERHESLFTFAINEPNFVEEVYNLLNPFEYKFQVLSHE